MRTTSLCLAILLSVSSLRYTIAADDLFAKLDRNADRVVQADEIDPAHQRLFARLLRTSDENGDGQLSATELATGLQPQQAEKPLTKKQGSEIPGADALLLLLAKMDTNANGEIEADEVPSQFRPVFDRIEDRLGGERDGVLDRRELNQAAPRLSHIAGRIAERMGLDVELELALLSEKQWQAAKKMTGRPARGQALADPKRAREYFKQLDANGDGQITLAEVPDQVAERFETLMDRADFNRDDQISEQELMTVSRMLQARAQLQSDSAKGPRTKEQAQNIERLLKHLDRDGDRRVSRREAPRRMADRFDRLDADGSGYLERKEIAVIVETLSRMRRPEYRPPARPANQSDDEMQPEG